ncbi:MAG: dihydroorotase [Saprospiraceae bacterium]|nr:dihydroorotase [Saprospiraceae bacterium]
MKILLKNAKVFQPNTSLNGKRVDIKIRNGKVEEIGRNLDENGYRVIKSKNLCVSPGWFDFGAQANDPGFEHREDLQSLSNAAAHGGFTTIAPYPNTFPVTDTKAGIQYIINKTKDSIVEFFPIGAVTNVCEGMEITEMYDMREAGAIAFSDGKSSIQHSGVLMRALQYVKSFDGVILNKPLDHSLSGKGQMHEGETSTLLGLKGIPDIGETIQVQRDLSVLEYADSRLHFAHLSSKESVHLVKKAKKQGLKITASIPVLNLLFQDEDLEDFETNLKVMPPLRGKKDQKSLIKGLQENTIDCICSNHTPLETEQKDLEFPYAGFGASTIEYTFPIAWTALKEELDLSSLVEKFVTSSRKIFNLAVPVIEEGTVANITVFDPDMVWVPTAKGSLSKSRNCPVVGKELQGQVLGIINKGKTNL